ncbi:NAD(P)-dependent alcohol dehydrogenase [soil metagenome]|jgi:NADPH:quinone reductase-like Zn-dependent oxidoreductase
MSENITTTRTMTAWRQSRYGGPEIVSAERVDVPAPGDHDVLLRVRATSLNAADHHLLRGEPLLLRLGLGLRRPRNATRGIDVAATVVAVGARVTQFARGDEVMGELPGGGALAEFAVSPAARLVARPAGLDAVTAAALPLAGGTAWQALEAGAVADGQRVLVIGASGGVGTYTVQLAVLRGAEVWALTGARSEQLVAELGARRTFDYRVTDVDALPAATFDAVLDIAGTAPLRTLKALLRPGGTLVLVAGDGGRMLGPLGRMLRAVFVSIGGAGRRIRPLAAVAKPEVTRELASLAAAGRLRAVIERTFTLSEAREALAHIDAGRTVGKVVVDVDPFADQGRTGRRSTPEF